MSERRRSVASRGSRLARRIEVDLAAEVTIGQTHQNGVYLSSALAPGKCYAQTSSRPIRKSPEEMSRLLLARSHAKEIEIGAGVTVSVTLVPGPID
jgi:hypothetical protein